MTPDGFGSIRDHDAIRIGKGMLYAALPQDGHMPRRNIDGRSGHYRKIVLKNGLSA